MTKTQNRILAERIVALEKEVKALSSSVRLRYSSIDDFAMPMKVNGETRSSLGIQKDGSSGLSVKRSMPPPQLTAPILTAGETAGVIECSWDGRTFDGRAMPEIHGHTEIWAQPIEDEWEPTVAPGPDAVRKGTIRDRAGGEDTIVLPVPGLWAVWLIAFGADRKTGGPWSPVSTIEVVPQVDTSEWQEQLDQARAEIAQAKEDLEAGQEDLDGRLTDLSGRQDSLRDDLDQGFIDANTEAERLANEARDEAVAQAAQDAQAEYDALQAAADAAQAAADAVADDLGPTSAAAQEAQAKADAATAAAEAAQSAAEDAHSEAGSARDLAQAAMDSAGGKSAIHFDESPPSGTGSPGDLWWQYETQGGRMVVVAQWNWSNGSWASAELAESFLPQVNIGTGTYGDLSGGRLQANSVKSGVIDTEEFFAAVAVIEKIYNDIVMSRLVQAQGIITEDMIATGAITTPKLTVTEEMVVEMAKFLRLEADSLASNEIIGMLIKGSRIEGVEIYGGEIESGHFSTSTSSGHTITIDQGDVTFQNTVTGGRETAFNAPHLSIRTDGISKEDAAYILMNEGNLVIAPGQTRGTPHSVFITSHMYAGAGTFEHRVSAGSIGGGAQSSLMPQAGLFLSTSSDSQPAGIAVAGPRAYLRGRTPDSHYHDMTFASGEAGSFTLNGSNGYVSGSWTYGAPAVQGTRHPHISSHTGSSGWSAYQWFGACSYVRSASGFDWAVFRGRYARSNTSNYGVWFYYMGVWN